MARIRKKSLIQRYSLPYTTRELVTTEATADNPFANSTESITFTRSELIACTIQSMSSWDLNNLPEGDRTKQMFTLFTNTNVYGSVEGTKLLADAIYIPSSMFGDTAPTGLSGWYTITSPKYRLNGIVPHIEAILTKDYYPFDSNNLAQFPSTTILDPLVNTKAKLQDSSNWLTEWQEENV